MYSNSWSFEPQWRRLSLQVGGLEKLFEVDQVGMNLQTNSVRVDKLTAYDIDSIFVEGFI